MNRSRQLQILIISEFYNNNANVIRDFLFSFNAHSRHKFFYIFQGRLIEDSFDFSRFDVILIFWSSVLFGPNPSIKGETMDRIRESNALKVLFLQDEYRFVREINAAMARLGIQIMFSCVDEQYHHVFYPHSLIPSLVATHTVLTGYVASYQEGRRIWYSGPKKIDIAYRSRELPYYLGDIAREKLIIAEKFKKLAPLRGFSVDISVREEDRIYGKHWIRFMQSARFALGTSSGASVIDFSGDIYRHCNEYLKNNPKAPYEEVRSLFFADIDGKYTIDTVSPRFFESAAIGNVMVNHEGRYSGIIIPDYHFIVIKKDYSNIYEVFDRMKDVDFCNKLTKNAYDDLIASGTYSYKTFVNRFDRIIEEYAGILPSQSRIYKLLFYGQRYLKYNQAVIPWRKGSLVLPSPGLATHLLGSSVNDRKRWDKVLKAFYAFKLSASIKPLRKILRSYFLFGSASKTEKILLLRELMLLGIIWQAQSGRLPAGNLFKVNAYLAESLLVMNSCLPGDFCREMSSDSWENLIMTGQYDRIFWRHSSVCSFIPYRVTNRKWLLFYPGEDETFYFDQIARIGNKDQALVKKALFYVLSGYSRESKYKARARTVLIIINKAAKRLKRLFARQNS